MKVMKNFMMRNSFAGGVVIASLCLVAIGFARVSAEILDVEWAVSSNPQIAMEQRSVTPNAYPTVYGCVSQRINVDGILASLNGCVTNGRSIRLAGYKVPNSIESRYAISFGTDSKFYNINGAGSPGNKYGPILIPGTDTVYARWYLDWRSRSLAVYKNFPSKLARIFTGTHTEYTWNTGMQDMALKYAGEGGELVQINGTGHSENGRWIMAEATMAGVILVDTENLASEIISKTAYPYGVGSDPSTVFTVSNDGKHAAMGGQNSYFTLFDIPSECGNSVTSQALGSGYVLPNACPQKSYYSLAVEHSGLTNVSNPSKYIRDMKFNNDGTQFSFFFGSSSDFPVDNPFLTFTAPGASAAVQLDYLALGDSFSSGEGDTERNPATNQKYYRTPTDVNGDPGNIPREKCHVSTRSYPYRLASWMQLTVSNPKKWNTVACAGAVKYDITQDNKIGYEGQWSGKGDLGVGRLHGLSNKSSLQTAALNEMIPGRKKQIEFVEKYQPKIITLTMGGNDVDFAGRLRACVDYFSPGTCGYAKLEWRNQLKNDLRDQYFKLKDLYEELKSASSNKAKIYVLGYPQFVNAAPGATCQNTFFLNDEEREMIVNSVTYFNNVIEQAAKAAGVKYIDIETAFGEHRLCDSGEKHVTAITNVLGWNGNERQESFHPNAKGHEDMANKVKQQLDNQSLLSYDPCPSTTEMYCRDATATKESISNIPYFTITNEDVDKKFTYYQLSDGEFVKTTPGNVSALPYTYDPNTPLEVTLYSDPVSLSTIQPQQDGSLSQTVTIPSTVQAGYHTLVLKGKTYSGESIQTYQTVLVKGINANDTDENGTPDAQQICGIFIVAANEDEDFDGIDDACDPEVTEPITYFARNGNPARGENSNKLYLFRNTRASSLTGIIDDYVNILVDPSNKEALVASSLDTQTEGIFSKFVMLESESDPNIKIPTILARDQNSQCFALQAVDYLLPALNPSELSYQLRGFTKLIQLPEGKDCE